MCSRRWYKVELDGPLACTANIVSVNGGRATAPVKQRCRQMTPGLTSPEKVPHRGRGYHLCLC